MLADGVGYTGAGVFRHQVDAGHHLFQKFFPVGTGEGIDPLWHDEGRREISTHAGSIDDTAARGHDRVKGIIDVDCAQRVGAQDGFRAAHVGTHASNVEQGFHLPTFHGVPCQLFAAGTVREVAGKGFGFVSGFGQLGHGAFQFCGSAAYQNHMISGFTDQLGRGAAYAAAAAGNHTDRLHGAPPQWILPVALSQAAVSWSVSA